MFPWTLTKTFFSKNKKHFNSIFALFGMCWYFLFSNSSKSDSSFLKIGIYGDNILWKTEANNLIFKRTLLLENAFISKSLINFEPNFIGWRLRPSGELQIKTELDFYAIFKHLFVFMIAFWHNADLDPKKMTIIKQILITLPDFAKIFKTQDPSGSLELLM